MRLGQAKSNQNKAKYNNKKKKNRNKSMITVGCAGYRSPVRIIVLLMRFEPLRKRRTKITGQGLLP